MVYTPDLSAGALNGITRNTIFAICERPRPEAGAKSASRATRSTSADEAFFTGTAAEVTPIRELDRIEIGAGSRGPITEKIQSAFFDIVNGRNPEVRRVADQGLNAMAPPTRSAAVVELLRQGPATARAWCSAPNPKMPLWSNHPRVYIDVATTGAGKCPYCGTVYRLKAGEKVHWSH